MLGESKRDTIGPLFELILIVGVGGCSSKPAIAPDERVTAAPREETQAPESGAEAGDSGESLEPDEVPGEPAAPFSTPQATFAALRKGAGSCDARQILACFTDDGALEIVGAPWLVGGLLMEGLESDPSDANALALAATFRQAFERHVPRELRPKSEAELKGDKVPVDVDLSLPEDQVRAQVRAAARQFKDPELFVATMLKAFDSYAKQEDPEDDGTTMKSSRLVDLRIDGDKATGAVTRGLLGFEDVRIRFVRSEGVWKIETLGNYDATSASGSKDQSH